MSVVRGGSVEQTDVMDIKDVLKARRAEIGMSQAQLAEAADVGIRQIARYESGDSEPGLGVAVRLAEALGISLTHLAGQIRSGLDLGGEWWAGWQTQRDGEEWVAVQHVEIVQAGDLLTLTAERSRPVEEGGYNWNGELRLWDNQALIGWYRAADAAVQSKGSLYFALHAQGVTADGRWVGLSYDGKIITGYAALCRDQDAVEPAIADMKERGGAR
ncbi:MAG: helix-turn-helix domain-containing protein [Acidimicrobiales bacterium]